MNCVTLLERIGDAGAMIVSVVGVRRGLAERVGFSQHVIVGVISKRSHAAARVRLAQDIAALVILEAWSDGPDDR